MSKNPGRVAGLLYLILVIAGPFRLIYIPDVLYVHGDATATAARIAAHEMVFRFGIVSDLLCSITLILLTLAFYRLFNGIDRMLAVLVVILGGVMPATIDFANAVNDLATLLLVRGAEFLTVFDRPQREALAMLFIRLHGQEILAAEILWGLWLFPLAILVYRSRFLPRFIGVWLIINGIAYLAMSLTGILLPAYEDMVSKVTFPALLGEMVLMLWLVIWGVPEAALTPVSPAAPGFRGD